MPKVREALAHELARELEKEYPKLKMGFFGGHYYRDEKGGYEEDPDEIPVIELSGLCDIELGRNGIDVTAKLRRETEPDFDYSCFDEDFEVYGVEDWLSDYYHPGMSFAALRGNILQSNEKEFFFSFRVERKKLLDFLKKIQRLGFYY